MNARKFSKNRLTGLWLILMILVFTCGTVSADEAVSIVVDVNQKLRTFNEKVLGIGGPDKRIWWAGHAELIATLSNAKIKIVRIGPAQTGLYNSNKSGRRDIYPEPGQWVWENVDPIIKTIFDAGSEPLFLVNAYPGGVPSYKTNGALPTSAAHWAEYARYMRGIVKHFNVDKALGPGHTIRYWEMWNEPEIEPDGKLTKDAYKAFFNTVGTAMKEVDPTIKLLGPVSQSYRFSHDWLPWAREHLTNLDIVSWHQYAPRWGSDEARMATNVLMYRDAVIAERALGKGTAITEYHCGSMSNRANYSNEFGAAFLGSALVNAIQGGVDIFSVFISYHPWENSVLSADFKPLRSFYPYYLLGNFHGETIVSSTGGNKWIEHVATTSTRSGETYVMVVNKDAARKNYSLSLKVNGMPSSGKVAVRKVDADTLPTESVTLAYSESVLPYTLS
ncbi:MAG: hypothetical protein JNM63_08395, partial [Spirochaetia bacterium]|nr:hypothetical protein [Spirochaetia bacterium]